MARQFKASIAGGGIGTDLMIWLPRHGGHIGMGAKSAIDRGRQVQ